MYVGAGAAPLQVAAAAWNGIAAELSMAASSFESVIAQLSGEHWMSSASRSMVAAVQPLLAWLNDTAASSERAAAQAMASAGAYETAHALVVPPAEVAANRTQLARLIATNTLGQNLSAIAATEARYGEMWAQDASAMYGYAASSASAARLDPLTSPSEVANPAGVADQNAAVGQSAASAEQLALSSMISRGPDAVTGLAEPVAAPINATPLEMLAWFDSADLPWVELFNHQRATYWDFSVGQIGTGGGDEERDDDEEIDLGLAPPIPLGLAQSVTPATFGETQLVVALGRASTVGGLSVPTSWANSTPVGEAHAALDGTYWSSPEEDELVEGMAPTPGMYAHAEDAGVGVGPRYGVKPVVMPKGGLF